MRVSRGVPRLANHLLHLALFIADDRDRDVLDEDIITAAAQGLHLEPQTSFIYTAAQTPSG